MLITTNYLTPKAKFMVQEDGGGRREHRFMIFGDIFMQKYFLIQGR